MCPTPVPAALGTAHPPFPPVYRSAQHPEPHEADVSIRAERFKRWGRVTAHSTLQTPCCSRSSLQLPTPMERAASPSAGHSPWSWDLSGSPKREDKGTGVLVPFGEPVGVLTVLGEALARVAG